MVETPLLHLKLKVAKKDETSFDDVKYLTMDNTTNRYMIKNSDIYYYQV